MSIHAAVAEAKALCEILYQDAKATKRIGLVQKETGTAHNLFWRWRTYNTPTLVRFILVAWALGYDVKLEKRNVDLPTPTP